MKTTIYASFADGASAGRAEAALVQAGAKPEDVTVVSRDTGAQRSESDQQFGAMSGVFPDLVGGQGSLVGDDASYGMRYSGIAATANASVEPGNMTEYLWDTLPPDMASDCHKELAAGRTILIVRDAIEGAQQILEAHGSSKVRSKESRLQ